MKRVLSLVDTVQYSLRARAWMSGPCPDVSKRYDTCIKVSWFFMVKPIYGCGVKIPIVPFIDVGLVLSGLDLIESFG